MALWLMKLFLIEYVIILIVTLIEKDWKLALYWLGAAILQIGLITMKGQG